MCAVKIMVPILFFAILEAYIKYCIVYNKSKGALSIRIKGVSRVILLFQS